MTAITGLAGHTNSKWKLGEIGALLRERMNEKVDTLDQLNLYMQRNDADMLYGARILVQIESILEEIKKNGLNTDVAVATESIRPGTIPPTVRKMLTSNYSRTGQEQTVVALESWAKAGRVGLVVLLVTALLKIIGWIIANGKPFGGGGDADPDKYKDDVDGQEKPSLPDGAIYDSLKSATVKELYGKYFTAASDKDSFNMGVAQVDKVIQDLGAEKYMNSVASVLGVSPWKSLFESYSSKGKRDENTVLRDMIDALLNLRLTSGIYKAGACKVAYDALPISVKQAGIHFPCELTYVRYAGMVGELTQFFGGMAKGFEALNSADLMKSFRKMGSIEQRGQRVLFPAGEVASQPFTEALGMLNNIVSIAIDDATRQFTFDNGPCVTVTPAQARNLIGYDEGVEIPGGQVIATAQEGAFLTQSSFATMTEKTSLSNVDMRGILKAIVSLGPDTFTEHKYKGRLDGYTVLQKNIEVFVDKLERWGKAVKDADKGYFDFLTDAVIKQLEAGRHGTGHGREFALIFFSNGKDFVGGMKDNLNLVRRLCLGAASLQAVLNSASKNPLVKK